MCEGDVEKASRAPPGLPSEVQREMEVPSRAAWAGEKPVATRFGACTLHGDAPWGLFASQSVILHHPSLPPASPSPQGRVDLPRVVLFAGRRRHGKLWALGDSSLALRAL